MRSPFPIARLLFSSVLFLPALANAQSVTVLHSFSGGSDGGNPKTSVIQASDGNYYGTALYGGASGNGVVFKITSDGTYSVLYSFAGGTSDGEYPGGALIESSDGNFYGTTQNGGAKGFGTFYKITPAGKETVLYNFLNQDDGALPNGNLVQDSDGNIWGVAQDGGAHTYGTIFKITTAGVLTPVYAFTFGDDGGYPTQGLVQGSDGNFYGTSPNGGANGLGNVFYITPAGTFTLLYSFNGSTDGFLPKTGLVEGSDGNFYGTTSSTTSNGNGVIFKITPGGTITHLFTFNSSNSADGGSPEGTLFAASDGNFYGTTAEEGAHGGGTLYKLTPSGSLSLLYSFTGGSDGANPSAGLLQGSDGNFYGTSQSQFAGTGAAFQLKPASSLASPVQLTLSSSHVETGSSVTLNWSVSNAFSSSMQLCYAFIQGSPSGAGTWNGRQPGTYSSSTKLFTGLASITPTTDGTYTYALTCGGQESGFATLTVTSGKSDSTTTLSASPSAPSVGQPVSIKATVSGPAGTPTGSVAFSVTGISIGSANLNSSGIGTLTASTNGIAPGSYPVIAVYSGDSSYNLSESKPLSVTLSKAPTATVLTASPTSVTPPASVTLTATVTRSATAAEGAPTGSVTFSTNGVTLASVKLNSKGVATLTAPTSGYPAGSYPILAIYSGDPSDSASTSKSVTVTVK